MIVPGFTKLCAWCSAPIPESKRVDAVFCSKRCKALHNQAVVRQGRLDDKRTRPPCEFCRGPVAVERPAFSRFCSKACHNAMRAARARAARVKPRPDRPCGWCGTTMLAPRPRRLFCSGACTVKAGRARRGWR